MKVLVLGAGVVGTTAAYYLNRAGCEVWVVDRQSAAGAETSFANGGQISVSHAEPWANPGAPLKVLRWLAKEDAPILFRLRGDLRQWLWGLGFMLECLPARTRHNIEQLVRLGTYSRGKLQELRAATGIQYDQQTRGILHFYTNPAEFDACHEPAAQMCKLGCERTVITPDEAVKIEPALAGIKHKLAGATYTSADESGDAHKFTVELAKIARANGVKFLFNHTVTGLRKESEKIAFVEATDPDGKFVRLKADAYVLALGSFSPIHAAPLGIRLAIYPAKGYSVTLPVKDESKAFHTSMTDDEYKLVFSRLGDRLRIAGTAELNGYERGLNRVRCEAIVRRVEELMPGAGDASRAEFWAGLRPATPSNVPYIGRSRISNLFLNTGHGTLGWTHSCGSGAALADIVTGRQPEVDFAFTGVKPPAAQSRTAPAHDPLHRGS
ncbi:MAG TPA: D-amino acid dehydrogenase [Burkholderiales bacterium]|nr:D-amino acid dehydrogenase [Burkholderiales bacterium]